MIQEADDLRGTTATEDSGVAALLQRAEKVQLLPVAEHNRHYVQLLGELKTELDADFSAQQGQS